MGLGIAVWQYNMVADLAQEGARWAAVRGPGGTTNANEEAIRTYVRGRALGMSVDVSAAWPDVGSPVNKRGNRVQVTVRKTFTPMTPFVPIGMLTLESTAQMVIAR